MLTFGLFALALGAFIAGYGCRWRREGEYDG